MKVLLIEDNPLVRDGLVRVLRQHGFTATAVANGLQGLNALRDDRFAAIVCDFRLPFLQGDDLFAQIREMFPEMAQRTVFVTGGSDPELRKFLEESGQPFLVKPFPPEDLVAAIRKVAAKV